MWVLQSLNWFTFLKDAYWWTSNTNHFKDTSFLKINLLWNGTSRKQATQSNDRLKWMELTLPIFKDFFFQRTSQYLESIDGFPPKMKEKLL